MEPRKPEGKRINKGATHNFKKNPKPESHMEQEDRSGSEQEEEDFEDEWEEEDVIEEEAQPESKPIIVPFWEKEKILEKMSPQLWSSLLFLTGTWRCQFVHSDSANAGGVH